MSGGEGRAIVNRAQFEGHEPAAPSEMRLDGESLSRPDLTRVPDNLPDVIRWFIAVQRQARNRQDRHK